MLALRELAFQGANEAKNILPEDQASRVVIDFLVWNGSDGKYQLQKLLHSSDRLIPVVQVERGRGLGVASRSPPLDRRRLCRRYAGRRKRPLSSCKPNPWSTAH